MSCRRWARTNEPWVVVATAALCVCVRAQGPRCRRSGVTPQPAHRGDGGGRHGPRRRAAARRRRVGAARGGADADRARVQGATPAPRAARCLPPWPRFAHAPRWPGTTRAIVCQTPTSTPSRVLGLADGPKGCRPRLSPHALFVWRCWRVRACRCGSASRCTAARDSSSNRGARARRRPSRPAGAAGARQTQGAVCVCVRVRAGTAPRPLRPLSPAALASSAVLGSWPCVRRERAGRGTVCLRCPARVRKATVEQSNSSPVLCASNNCVQERGLVPGHALQRGGLQPRRLVAGAGRRALQAHAVGRAVVQPGGRAALGARAGDAAAAGAARAPAAHARRQRAGLSARRALPGEPRSTPHTILSFSPSELWARLRHPVSHAAAQPFLDCAQRKRRTERPR